MADRLRQAAGDLLFAALPRQDTGSQRPPRNRANLTRPVAPSKMTAWPDPCSLLKKSVPVVEVPMGEKDTILLRPILKPGKGG